MGGNAPGEEEDANATGKIRRDRAAPESGCSSLPCCHSERGRPGSERPETEWKGGDFDLSEIRIRHGRISC